MNKDRKIPWESISIYCFTFGGMTGAAAICSLLIGCSTGYEILKYTGMSLSITSGMGVVVGVISAIVSSRTAKKKERNLSPETENPSEEIEEGHGEYSSPMQYVYESDNVCEASDAGGSTEENDKKMPREISGIATGGKADSEADMAKKEYMVKLYEETVKNIKVMAKDSCEAVELAKKIYRNESPIASHKDAETTVTFSAELFRAESDSEYKICFGKKEGGNVII